MTPRSAVGVRPHLIGDSVASLVVARHLKRRFPTIDMHWAVARKCSQSAPLYIEHPDIDRILVCDGDRYGQHESFARSCDITFDPCPSHPDGDAWPCQPGRTIYSETWLMAGFSLAEYDSLLEEDKTPRLVPWFKTERRAKSIAIWPGSRQGEKENRRNPPGNWWTALAYRLKTEGYTVYQCGHPNDLADHAPLGVDARHQSFMDLIGLSLGCDLAIGTDSGSMIALAAYHSTPTLSLLSPHWPGHVSNPLAFGPLGKRHTNLWAPSNLDHDVEKVVDTVRQLT